MFRSCDTSGDNKVTLEEFLTAMGELPPAGHKYVMFTNLVCYIFRLQALIIFPLQSTDFVRYSMDWLIS